jgi:hypothetical protein
MIYYRDNKLPSVVESGNPELLKVGDGKDWTQSFRTLNLGIRSEHKDGGRERNEEQKHNGLTPFNVVVDVIYNNTAR